MALFVAQDVVFTYNTLTEDGERKTLKAIDAASFEIDKGEFVAILGHNGSGKSTLAKLMNALFLPTDGVLYVNGINSKNEEMVWDIRRSVGMVFQNPDNQIVATIVEEDVAFGLENMGVPQKELREKVDEALARVSMTEYAQHSPYMLSGGQKQRVAIAGIIAMKPACIVLDEPTAMLDPVGRREVLDTIKMLNKQEGISIVLITHFVEETVDCDRVIVMDNGEIKMNGTPKEVICNTVEFEKYGLEIPVAAQIASRLADSGMDVPRDILSMDELVEALCR